MVKQIKNGMLSVLVRLIIGILLTYLGLTLNYYVMILFVTMCVCVCVSVCVCGGALLLLLFAAVWLT